MNTHAMINREGDVIGATSFGALIGYVWTQYAAIAAWIPPWVGQAIVTLLIGGIALVVNHFLKRELNRRWPDENKSADDAEEEDEP